MRVTTKGVSQIQTVECALNYRYRNTECNLLLEKKEEENECKVAAM